MKRKPYCLELGNQDMNCSGCRTWVNMVIKGQGKSAENSPLFNGIVLCYVIIKLYYNITSYCIISCYII